MNKSEGLICTREHQNECGHYRPDGLVRENCDGCGYLSEHNLDMVQVKQELEKCEFAADTIFRIICHRYNCTCFDNCDYKQLLAATEQNEHLKKENKNQFIIIEKFAKKVRQLTEKIYKYDFKEYQCTEEIYNLLDTLVAENINLKNKTFYLTQDNQIHKEENEKLKVFKDRICKVARNLMFDISKDSWVDSFCINANLHVEEYAEENRNLKFQIENIYKYQIRSLKSQIYQLDKENKTLRKTFINYRIEIKELTQQNKQMWETLEKIAKGYDYCWHKIAKQALGDNRHEKE